MSKNNVYELFSPNLFWDIDEQTLDYEAHSRYVVERVLMRGKLVDWSALVRLYGETRIKQEALQIRYLDHVTLSFCSHFFDVPKFKFRCYKRTQSTHEPWQY